MWHIFQDEEEFGFSYDTVVSSDSFSYGGSSKKFIGYDKRMYMYDFERMNYYIGIYHLRH